MMAGLAPQTLPVIIIGAGVSGLALAQGLRLRSIPFRLFERHPRFHGLQGHRFRISKDAISAMKNVLSFELWDLFNATTAQPAKIRPRYVKARDLVFPASSAISIPESMPIDRAWIRVLLTLGVEDAIEYDTEFSHYELDGLGGVTVSFSNGSSVRGCLLVGADGIKSSVRRQLQPTRRLLDLERWITWGRTPLTKSLREQLPDDVLSWFMAQDIETNLQAIVEPMIWTKSVEEVSDGSLPDFADYIYWAVSTASEAVAPRTADERRAFLDRITESWHPALRLVLVEAAAHELSVCAPVLSSKPDIEARLSAETGRVTLIGDAAHAMSPMGGEGGNTAIQDAADLAQTIGDEAVTQTSLRGFEERMAMRAKDKIEYSFSNGRKFWNGKDWSKYAEFEY